MQLRELFHRDVLSPFPEFLEFLSVLFLTFFFKLCLLLSFKSNSSSPLQNPNSISDTVNIVIFTQVKHFQSRTETWCSVWKFQHDTCFENVQVFCFLLLPIECPLYQCIAMLMSVNVQKRKIFNTLTSKLVTRLYRLRISLLLFPRSVCPKFKHKEKTTTRKCR